MKWDEQVVYVDAAVAGRAHALSVATDAEIEGRHAEAAKIRATVGSLSLTREGRPGRTARRWPGNGPAHAVSSGSMARRSRDAREARACGSLAERRSLARHRFLQMAQRPAVLPADLQRLGLRAGGHAATGDREEFR